MVDVFLKVLDMSVTASWVILAVMAARVLIRKAPKKYSYALWVVALFRLLCPVSLQSVVSAFNFRPFRQAAQTTGELQFIPRENIPQIDTGIPVVDTVINTKLPALDTVVDATVPAVDAVVNSNVPAAVPEAALTPMETLLFVGMAAWVIGMLALVIVSVVNYIRLRKELRFATRMEGNVWQCETVRSPFLVGLIKPKIYIPYGLDEQTQGYILAHERYHLKRFDHIAKLLGYAALTLHWFNPLCHLAFRQMNSDMEMSCDEYVLDRNNIPTTQYSYSLLTIAMNRRFPAATPLAFAETGVKERMINVLKWKKPKKWVSVVAVMVCLILLISCATNPKVTIPTGDGPAVEDSQTALLEFPGLKWNMTPEEVKNALNLTNDQIVRENKQEADTRSAMPHEGYTIQVQNLSLLGADILNAKFSFVRYEGNDFGLCSVEIYYPEETNMQIVVDDMAEFYGEGTDDPFIDHTFIDGKLTPLINSDNRTINGKVWAPEKDPDYIRSYWRSTKKGTEVLSADAQSRMANFYAGIEHLQITPEVALELLEKQPMVQVYAVNRNRTAAQYGDKLSGITHNYVRYAADYLVQMIQRFSTNPINQEGQLTPSLLEFPGLKWGMTPEEVKTALELTEEQIVSQKYSEGDENESTCRLSVKNTTFLDEEVSLATFQFSNKGKGYKLHRIDLYLDEDVDMNEMNNALTEVYGEGTGEYYLNYHIDVSGKLQEGKRRGDTELGQQYNMYTRLPEKLEGSMQRKRDAVFGIVEDPEFMVEHWVSSAKGTEVLPENGQELFVQFFEETEQADRETVMAWFEKVPLVAIITQNRSLAAAMHEIDDSPSEESAYVTHNQVIFDAGNLIYFIEGIERLTPVGDPALLEFPGLKWGASVEEVKIALNIQEEQISTDDFQEANNFDTHLLHVKDITFFGEEVSLGCFKFRSVDEENLGLSYIMLFLDEDTDMEHLLAELSYQYQNQGTGETFDTCQWNIKDKVNYDPEEKDRPAEYELEEGKSRGGDAELWRLVNNPPSGSGYNFYEAALKVVEDPEFKTYNWVSPVKLTEVISPEGQNALKEAYETYSNIDPSLTQKFLENRPTVRMSISNRTWQAARVELEGITEGELTLATHNLVILDAQTLIELQYEAQRLQKVLESE